MDNKVREHILSQIRRYGRLKEHGESDSRPSRRANFRLQAKVILDDIEKLLKAALPDEPEVVERDR